MEIYKNLLKAKNFYIITVYYRQICNFCVSSLELCSTRKLRKIWLDLKIKQKFVIKN